MRRQAFRTVFQVLTALIAIAIVVGIATMLHDASHREPRDRAVRVSPSLRGCLMLVRRGAD